MKGRYGTGPGDRDGLDRKTRPEPHGAGREPSRQRFLEPERWVDTDQSRTVTLTDEGSVPTAEFLAEHERDLAAIPTWLFASGPLDHVPAGAKSDVPDGLVDVIGRVGPRDVALFAGSLQPHHLASGLQLLSRLARTNVGDHRDWEAIERWANGIRDTLLAEAPAVARGGWRPGEGS